MVHPEVLEQFCESVRSLDAVSAISVTPELDDGRIEPSINRLYAFDLNGNPGNRLYSIGSASLSAAIDVAIIEEPSFTPFMSSAVRRSRHGVFFGELVVSERLGIRQEVAVRPHGTVKEAASDLFKNLLVRKLGIGNTEHIGMLVSSKELALVLSALKRDLTTFDTIYWAPFRKDPEAHLGMQDLLRKTMEQLAYTHHIGVGHGDAHPRNIAVCLDGAVFNIDWEDATFGIPSDRDAELNFARSYADMVKFIEGITFPPNHVRNPGLGIFEPAGSSEEWQQMFDRYMWTHYKEHREALNEQEGIYQPPTLNEELQELERSVGLEIVKQHEAVAAQKELFYRAAD